MIARDGPCCVVPGCSIPVEECQAHHLCDYGDGGFTNVADGGHLCTGHHHDIHLGGAHLIRCPDGWTYTTPNGTTHHDTDRP